MKVRQLIERLSTLDQESIVVESGYEGGIREIFDASPIKLRLNVNVAWYYGPHEEADEDEEGVSAVFLG